jgi:hypothetical protein
MSTTPSLRPTSSWQPTAAEVEAILAELRPLIQSFAERDRRWLDALGRGDAPEGPGRVGQLVAA